MAKRRKQDGTPASREEMAEIKRQLAQLQNLLRATGKPETVVRQQMELNRSKLTREAQETRRERSATGRLLPMDPADIRASRIGLRIHSDLRMELERAAREDGLLLTVWIQKALAQSINDRAGTRVLDAIGRYVEQRR